MDSKSSFIFYPAEFLAVVHNFRKSQISDLIVAISQHNQFGKISIPIKEPVHSAFVFLQKRIDENNQKYFEIVEKRRVGGQKGGRPKKEEKNLKVFKSDKKSENKNPDKDSDKEKDKDKDRIFIINNKNVVVEPVDAVDNLSFDGSEGLVVLSETAVQNG